MQTPRTPSIASLIFADYASLLCFLFPVITWGIFAAAALGLWRSEPGEAESKTRFTFWAAAASTAICAPLLYRRIRGIRSLLRDGVTTPARLIGVWFKNDRGRIDYEYTHEGQIYRGGMALLKSTRTASLKEGQEIIIVVDPSNPSRSVVAEMFG